MNQHRVFLTFLSFFLFSSVAVIDFLSVEAQETPLLSQRQVEPFGLTRIWFNQAEIDPVRSKVIHAIVEGDTLFLVSDDAKLHAIDAENGKSLWSRSLGRRDMLFQEPAANSRMVAVLNGLELFVFNRYNGKLLLNTPLPGAASTACEISENYVYIPMMGGRIVAYPLEDNLTKMESSDGTGAAPTTTGEEPASTGSMEDAAVPNDGEDPVLANIVKRFGEAKQLIYAEPAPPKKEPDIVLRGALGIPMVCQSFGNLLVKPKLTSQTLVYTPRNHVRMHRETVAWVTDRGFLFAAGINSLSQEDFELQYMVDSSAQTYFLGSDRIAQREWTRDKEIVARPTSNQCVPYLYTTNRAKAYKIPSLVVTGSKGAYVFAVQDRTGEVAWQFAAVGPVTEQIAVIGTDVYCPASEGLHAIDLLTGEERWYTPEIRRFVAASEDRLYTIDNRTRLVILDRKTGDPLGSFDVRAFDQILFNVETDRLFFINQSGLVQCLVQRQPQATEDLTSDKPVSVIRHRLSCRQYAEVLRGAKGPRLYWLKTEDGEEEDGESDDESDSGDDDDPFATPRSKKKASGEDGSLDGNETDEKDESKGDQKPQDDVDDDPFG